MENFNTQSKIGDNKQKIKSELSSPDISLDFNSETHVGYVKVLVIVNFDSYQFRLNSEARYKADVAREHPCRTRILDPKYREDFTRGRASK